MWGGVGRQASWLFALGNQAWYRFTRTQKKKDLIEVGAEHYLLKVYYVLDQLIFLTPLLGTQSS